MAIKLTTEEFIKRSNILHQSKYDYSATSYINTYTKVKINCPEHGRFSQTPKQHIRGEGCPTCAPNKKCNREEFISKALIVHGDQYTYQLVKYVGNKEKVLICCNRHGKFNQTPNHHLNGHGCPKCARERQNDNTRLTTTDFVKKAIEIHGNKYDYSNTKYDGVGSKVSIVCKEHGEFAPTANNHTHHKSGCPKCAKRAYSGVAINWLKNISENKKLYIQHAENIGEYKIPNTLFSADGYCKETNTIYEFYGDVFHGNPLLFKHDDHCHPYDKNVTAGELLRQTKNREKIIKDLGYNLITTWETT
jgi:predicted nucleic-acid-binding Zn-ribbon protein